MEKTTSEKIKLGLFVVLGTVVLVFGAYQIGNQENLFGETFTINAEYTYDKLKATDASHPGRYCYEWRLLLRITDHFILNR